MNICIYIHIYKYIYIRTHLHIHKIYIIYIITRYYKAMRTKFTRPYIAIYEEHYIVLQLLQHMLMAKAKTIHI